MMPSKLDSFTDLYVVTDYMDADLHDVIRINNRMSKKHIQFFMY